MTKNNDTKVIDLKSLSDDELFSLRIQLDAELNKRGLNLSVGELGEKLAINHFNSTPGLSNLMEAPVGAKNIDAISRDGERYSIKTQIKAKKTGTIYPDSINPDKQLFEHLLVVKLSHDYKLEALYQFSWDAFLRARAWDKRMNAWYIPVNTKRLSIADKIFTNSD